MLHFLLQWGCIQWHGSSRGTPSNSTKRSYAQGQLAHTGQPPVKEATMDIAMKSTVQKRPPNQFSGWEKVLHLSRPVVATGQIPPLSRGPKPRPHSWSLGERLVQHHQTNESRMSATQSEPPSPTKELDVVQGMMLPPGFAGETACLQREQLLEEVCKVSPGLLGMAVISGPAMAAMSTIHIVKDKVMGATYMDTVTTLVRQVTFSSPKQETLVQGPIIEDVTDLA